MVVDRGVFVDHATVHHWVLKIVPALIKVFRCRKRPVGKSLRMDETYVKVRGQWKYLYRAFDRDGDRGDFLLTARRDQAAARRFLVRAIDLHGQPEKITIDKSGPNTTAVGSYNAAPDADIEPWQCKYLNDIVEQDHGAIKRLVRPMLGFKSMLCAWILLGGVETMHMIPKGQLASPDRLGTSVAEQFYPLAY